MVVRIRFGKGSKLGGTGKKTDDWHLYWPLLMPPSALAGGRPGVLANRRRFEVGGQLCHSSGIFSHWQVWLGGGRRCNMCARALNRYGKSGDPAAS